MPRHWNAARSTGVHTFSNVVSDLHATTTLKAVGRGRDKQGLMAVETDGSRCFERR